MTKEVQALRPNHNMSPDTAISDVARALRRYIEQNDFDRVLEQLPKGAAEFWQVDPRS